MIWAARSIWLWRSKIVPNRASTSGIAFFTPLSPQPCPHGSPFLVFPPVGFRQGFSFSHLSRVVSGIHIFPPVFVARVMETVLPACAVSMSPAVPLLTRSFEGAVLLWVRINLPSRIVIVGDPCFSRSPSELWVPA